MQTFDHNESCSPSTRDNVDVRYVITLVHGTVLFRSIRHFLRFVSKKVKALIPGAKPAEPEWWQAELGSRFSQKLTGEFNGTAKCVGFHWSGRNSPKSRDQAATAFVSHAKALRVMYPTASHFVVAHSHGGNIVFYALRDCPELQHQIAGVICLSTPFLYVQIRQIGFFMKFIWISLLSIQLSAVLIYLSYSVLSMLLGFEITETVHIFRGFTILVCGIAFAVWFYMRFQYGCLKLEKLTKLPSALIPNVLIVKTPADEIFSFLTICRLGVWLMDKTLWFLMLPILTAERFAGNVIKGLAKLGIVSTEGPYASRTLAASIVSYFSYYILLILYFSPFSTALLWHNMTGEPFALFSLLVMIPFIIMYMVPLMCIPLTIPTVGVTLAFSYIFLKFSAELTPPGFHQVIELGRHQALTNKMRCSLNHSLTYLHPESVATISRWIKNVRVPGAN